MESNNFNEFENQIQASNNVWNFQQDKRLFLDNLNVKLKAIEFLETHMMSLDKKERDILKQEIIEMKNSIMKYIIN